MIRSSRSCARTSSHGCALVSSKSFSGQPERDRHGGNSVGGYGRLFDLPACEASEKALFALATAMRDPDPGGESGDSPDVLAGYTYLGQFIAHDITFDPSPPRSARPGSIPNLRTPALDLDSIYGLGPDAQPYLYSNDLRFALGQTERSYHPPEVEAGDNLDFARSRDGRAIIGDPRNDENLIVAQIHVALLRLHNHVIQQLGTGVSRQRRFAEARRVVRWHFQWVVVNRFLPRIVANPVLDRIALEGPRWFPGCQPVRIPAEFAAAVFRFGHAMTRESYDINRVFSNGGVAARPGSLEEILRGGEIFHKRRLRGEWVVDWRRFFEPSTPGIAQNRARAINPFVTPSLFDLPGIGALPLATLTRGALLGLPSGQRLAEAMEIEPLSRQELTHGAISETVREHGLEWETPLWFYVLKEAEQRGTSQGSKKDKQRLGELGSTVVTEIIYGLLLSDPESYLSREPTWKPTLPGAGSSFQVSDLLRYAELPDALR